MVRRGMPGEMYGLYHEYKYDEWARFMSTVTEWDKERYMEIVPHRFPAGATGAGASRWCFLRPLLHGALPTCVELQELFIAGKARTSVRR